MNAKYVINAVRPLLAVQIRAAQKNGMDEIRIPIGRAIGIMRDLEILEDKMRREASQKQPSEAFNRVKWA
jgi:hypothetical protein